MPKGIGYPKRKIIKSGSMGLGAGDLFDLKNAKKASDFQNKPRKKLRKFLKP